MISRRRGGGKTGRECEHLYKVENLREEEHILAGLR